jgi:hypothetical protein
MGRKQLRRNHWMKVGWCIFTRTEHCDRFLQDDHAHLMTLHLVRPLATRSRAVTPSGERNHPRLHFSI